MTEIFLIDNNVHHETFNASVLKELGHRVMSFSDPLLALNTLKEVDAPDVIFIEFDIPRIHNLEFFDVVASVHPAVPVVITAHSPFPSSDVLRRTPHFRYRLFGGLRKESVQLVLQSIFRSNQNN